MSILNRPYDQKWRLWLNMSLGVSKKAETWSNVLGYALRPSHFFGRPALLRSPQHVSTHLTVWRLKSGSGLAVSAPPAAVPMMVLSSGRVGTVVYILSPWSSNLLSLEGASNATVRGLLWLHPVEVESNLKRVKRRARSQWQFLWKRRTIGLQIAGNYPNRQVSGSKFCTYNGFETLIRHICGLPWEPPLLSSRAQ